jgi:ABC-type lipoprotein release transport system permease subunit
MSVTQNASPIHSIQIRAARLDGLAERVRTTLHQIDPTFPVEEIVPFETQFNGGLGTEKLLARLAAVYATLTLLLVAIGFYGVMSSRTARRKSEFGVRLALGATRRNIQMLIVGQTTRILLAGVVPGLFLSWAAMRLSRHLLVGSTGTSSLVAFGATIALALAGALATLIPARRAGQTDPLETLRSE